MFRGNYDIVWAEVPSTEGRGRPVCVPGPSVVGHGLGRTAVDIRRHSIYRKVVQFLTYAKLLVPPKLKPSLEKVRAAIERDDFFSADVKKLSNTRFFRAKLDYENRLLLQFVEHGGKRACLALELIEHHAYDRSRFLRGAWIDEANAPDTVAVDSPQLTESVQAVRYLHPSRAEFHLLDKPLSFDDRQAELYTLPLPLILVGCAGSGKTALTLTKLRDIKGDVLYVTQSPYLAESAAALYFAQGYENPEQNVDFLSYRALLESVRIPEGRAVTLKDFRGFFRRHEQTLRFTTAHQLFEELRGVLGADPNGPLSLEQYLARGVRQSIYRQEQRPAIHAMFVKYQSWLRESRLYDTNLLAHEYRTKIESRYDAIVVDEVQDLTNAELSLVLASLKRAGSFLLCGDANQIVHPNFFSWASVKSLFYSHETAALDAAIHVLEANYRSSRAVCNVANDVLKIKNARFGSIDRESTALVRPASDHGGRVLGLVKKDSVLRELNQRTRESARVAVIVLSEDQKAAVRQKLSTPLVFSIHEAKGLEYEAVILYDIVSSERTHFSEIVQGVDNQDLKASDLSFARAKDKTDKSLEIYKFFVNALYVALTRAVEVVYMVESDVGHPLLSLLGIGFGEDLTQVDAKASSLDEWQKEARRLELQGKDEQAQAIRQSILRVTPVPWPVIDAASFRELHERAFAPNSAFNKAKQRIFEFSAFHGLATLAYDLKRRTGYIHPKPLEHTAISVRERSMEAYLKRDTAKVLSDVKTYGLEHRNMVGMTSLMMAVDTENLELTEKLLELGARADAVDTLGRMPIHFALHRAMGNPTFAKEQLGTFFDYLCPTAIEVEVDGRRIRLAKNQGEFMLLLLLVARFHEFYRCMQRQRGFSAELVNEKALAHFPRSVIPDERRRRTYWNGVLARAEVGSSYRPARKLWRRERVGHYVPSSVAVRVAGANLETESYVPLTTLLALDLIEPALHGS